LLIRTSSAAICRNPCQLASEVGTWGRVAWTINVSRSLLEQHDEHTDPRAARYWELVGIITNQVPSAEHQAEIGIYPWLIEALRAKVARDAARS
jgi:hypothetical protein